MDNSADFNYNSKSRGNFITGKFLAVTFCLAIIAQTISCQRYGPVFQSLQNGLSRKFVKCILKDSQGYMWFGTDDGLNRYDGISFKVYENNPDDSNSLSHSAINDMIEDHNNRLWIGTAKGLDMYDRDKDNFIKIMNSNRMVGRIINMYINKLLVDKNNNLWIGTLGSGLIKYNSQKSTFHYYFYRDSDNATIGSNFITALLCDNEHNIWIGTRSGLDLLRAKSDSFIHFKHDQKDPTSLSNNVISSLDMDSTGNIWVGTHGGGLNRLINKNGRVSFVHYQHNNSSNSLSNNYILSLCNDPKGNLWIGTENGGLNFLHVNSSDFVHYQTEENNSYSITSNSIWSLYYDNTGILWIGTYNKGINIIDRKFKQFELYQHTNFSKNSLGNNDVTGFTEDNKGNLWVATDGGGLSYFDTKQLEFIKSVKKTADNNNLSNNAIMAILFDTYHNLWVGSWAGGLDRLDQNGKRVRHYNVGSKNGSGNNNVIDIYEDRERRIWVGTAGSGLYIYNRPADKFIQIIDTNLATQNINTAYVTSVLEDDNHTFWVTTLYGLARLKPLGNDKFSFHSYFHSSDKTSISSNGITLSFQDSKKRMWIGTNDRGLDLYNKNNNTFKTYLKSDGLPNNCIKGILEDAQGFLWISTNKGISKFNPETNSFKNFGVNDGLNSDEFYPRSCFKSTTGKFYFGGNNGFNAFYPDSFRINNYVPPVHLTDFKLFNKFVKIGAPGSPLQKSIGQTHQITLTYKQNAFTIDFVALNYTHAFKNQYACMLKGLENDWNYIGTKRSATYNNLSPGNYTFMVKGSNNDGIWNNIPATVQIRILPPWWKTVWAYIAYLLIFTSLFYAFISLLMTRAKQSHMLKLERMQHEKEEELNMLKLQFFTNISHELRTPLSLILSPLQNLLSQTKASKEIKDQLINIHRNADRLYRLVNELMDFSKSDADKLHIQAQPGDIIKFTREITWFFDDLAHQRLIDLEFIPGDEVISTWFDRNKLEKILYNLLSNAFKFSPDNSKITVKVEKVSRSQMSVNHLPEITSEMNNHKKYVRITVTDNGRGISPEYIEKIFDRFYQSPDNLDKNQLGTGIGLALTKSFVELHHGTISVTSTKNRETCFTILLPMGKDHFSPEEILNKPIDIDQFAIEPITEDISESDLKGHKGEAPLILIVEDNYDLRNYLAGELEKIYDVEVAKDGEEGIQKAFEIIPDLIISDVLMPVKSGIELCRTVKNDLRTSHIPLILLTARVTVEEQIAGVETGADIYITKPFNIRFLLAQIKNLIESRVKLYALFSQEVYIMPAKIATNKVDEEFLKNITDYIVQHIADAQLGVELLAQLSKLSRSQIYRKIKALTGKSPVEFIRIVRLKQAVKLMDMKKYTLSEIAYETGFTSPSYFTKSFKDHYGKAPSDYLKKIE